MNSLNRPFLLIVLLLLSSSSLLAQTTEVPHYINFQSVLRDDSGNLITDSSTDLEFRILGQDGTELYSELQPGVQVIRSSVNVMIGEGVFPGSSTPTGGLPIDALDPSSGSKFLQIKIGSNLPSDPMDLGTVPYAMYAERASGLAPNMLAADVPGILVTEDELAAAIADNLTTSTIFGGDVSGNYNSLQLGTGVVGTNEIADGSITTSDLNAGSFSGWDQNASDDLTTGTSFGGDVSGTYNSLAIGPNAVGEVEIDEVSTRSAGLTPFAFASLASPDNSCTPLNSYNISSVVVTNSPTDCLTKARGCLVTFASGAATSNYVVVVTASARDGDNLGNNDEDDNPVTCDKGAGSFVVSGGPSNVKIDLIVFQ